MVFLRNVSVDTLHKGDTKDDNNNNNSHHHHHHHNLEKQQFLWNSRTARSISVYEF
jgi:hypothetical protein